MPEIGSRKGHSSLHNELPLALVSLASDRPARARWFEGLTLAAIGTHTRGELNV